MIPDTCVADDADGHSTGEPDEATGESGGEVRVAIEEIDLGVDAGGDDDGDDEAVDTEDCSHDDRDDGLHDELRAHGSHRGDADATLGRPVGSAHAWIQRWVREGGRDLVREATGRGGGWGPCSDEKTSAAATPRKPKKGAVSSLLKVKWLPRKMDLKQPTARVVWRRRSKGRRRRRHGRGVAIGVAWGRGGSGGAGGEATCREGGSVGDDDGAGEKGVRREARGVE
jgi:hypothetical protein